MEHMDPEPGPEEPKAKSRPLVRWVFVPLGAAWLGMLLTAPFALVDERITLAGCLVGLCIGLGIAMFAGESFKVAADALPSQPRRLKQPSELSATQRWVLTLLGLAFAGIVFYATMGSNADRGFFFFAAAFLMISFARRAFRRAWGVPGSVAGMISSGALLFLLFQSATEGNPNAASLVALFTGLLVLLEALDEVRGLKRLSGQ